MLFHTKQTWQECCKLLKRILSILFSLTIVLSLASCKDKQKVELESEFESSVSLVCEKMDVSREEAISILELLSFCGLDEKIDEIYAATDTEGKTFYKVWFGLNLLSVYLDGASVEKIYKHGEQLYPEAEETEKDETTNDGTENNGGSNDGNEEEETKPETVDLDLTLVSLTTPIKAGKSATIEVIAEPNTKYSITVRYSSGPSSAKGLEPANSDESGRVSWTWRVSSNVKPGEYTIEIKSGNAVYKTTFVVEESSDE